MRDQARVSDGYLAGALNEISRARELDSQMISTAFLRMLCNELVERRSEEKGTPPIGSRWLQYAPYAQQIWAPMDCDEGESQWRVRGNSGQVYCDDDLGHALKDLWNSEIRARDAEGNPIEPDTDEALLDRDFQARVGRWMHVCFTPDAVTDKDERNDRFLEESLELVQSLGSTAERAHMLVDYVFGRPVGEPHQEAGGVMVTLAALGNANSIPIQESADTELSRCWLKIGEIRAKQLGKPRHSPLPGPSISQSANAAQEPPYRVRAFWSPCRKYLVTAYVPAADITLMDDNSAVWDPAGPEQDMTKIEPISRTAPATLPERLSGRSVPVEGKR